MTTTIDQRQEAFHDVRDVCTRLGIGRSKVYLLMGNGKLKWEMHPDANKRVVRESDLAAYIARKGST